MDIVAHSFPDLYSYYVHGIHTAVDYVNGQHTLGVSLLLRFQCLYIFNHKYIQIHLISTPIPVFSTLNLGKFRARYAIDIFTKTLN